MLPVLLAAILFLLAQQTSFKLQNKQIEWIFLA